MLNISKKMKTKNHLSLDLGLQGVDFEFVGMIADPPTTTVPGIMSGHTGDVSHTVVDTELRGEELGTGVESEQLGEDFDESFLVGDVPVQLGPNFNRRKETFFGGSFPIAEPLCDEGLVVLVSTMVQKDYIKKLPNDVLSHILSRLPIKDAVRTSVLSKDWEFKWTSIYNVDIDTFAHELKDEETFVSIAEKVLLHVLSIRKCRLVCTHHVKNELNRVIMLLSAVLRRNIKCLEVEIYNSEDFVLPRSLLTCDTLTKLSLSFDEPCSLRVPANTCWPNLKNLSLESVKISKVIPGIDTIVFTLPVLKVLKIVTCKWVEVKFVEIYAPSLRKVTSITPYEWDDKKDIDYIIKIIGSRVNELNMDGGYLENICVIGSTIANASLRCNFDHPLLSLEECGLQARKKLWELQNLIWLSIFDLRAIGQTGSGLPLPRFRMLKELHLYSHFDAEGFLKLLHAAPNLKFLAILLDGQYLYDYDSVEPLPSCVLHQLEEVKFDYSKNYYLPHNYLIEKFLLRNGANLKTVFILDRPKFLSSREQKLSGFPKASPRINISWFF